MIFKFLGIFSALLLVAGDIPYLKETIVGNTRPHRVSWGVITLISSIAFANQYASGATNSLWIYTGGTVICGAIFIASLWHGEGGKAPLDLVSLAIALAGVVLWLIFKSPLWSIASIVVADVALLTPTFAKARKAPETETLSAWLFGGISAGLSGISVGKLDWQLLILPFASLLLQAYIVYILVFETRRK